MKSESNIVDELFSEAEIVEKSTLVTSTVTEREFKPGKFEYIIKPIPSKGNMLEKAFLAVGTLKNKCMFDYENDEISFYDKNDAYEFIRQYKKIWGI